MREAAKERAQKPVRLGDLRNIEVSVDGQPVVAKKRDDLGVPFLFEYRGDHGARLVIRYWQAYSDGEGGYGVRDVTTETLGRLMTRLGRAKMPKPDHEDTGAVREGYEKDPIPEPGRPNVTVQVARKVETIERLVRDRSLKSRHKLAADRLYQAYMVGVEGASEADGEMPPEVHIAPWMQAHASQRRIQALREYREAIAGLGEDLAEAVVYVAVLDHTMNQLAEKLRWDKRRALGYVQAGLECLAQFYEIP